MKHYKDFIFVIFSVVLSVVSGILSHDLLIGSATLLTALLSAYYSSVAKSINYVFAFINCLLIGYTGFENGLHGYFVFYIFIFAPLQVLGYFMWRKHKDKRDNLLVRRFTLKNAIIMLTSCIFGSFSLAFLLNLIPSQRLAIMDASSVILNLCAFILMTLRFRECWWVWIANNIIDLTIWIVNVVSHGSNAIMMLLVSISYLLINIYGIFVWQKQAKKNKIEKAY